MRPREATRLPHIEYLLASAKTRRRGRYEEERCCLDQEDVVIGLDLASAEHQVAVLAAATGHRLTRFKSPHSRAGLEELLACRAPGRARTARASVGYSGTRRP